MCVGGGGASATRFPLAMNAHITAVHAQLTTLANDSKSSK